MTPVLFADSNVLIEALLIPKSAAYVVAEMVARGVFDLSTCQICVADTGDAIVAKLKGKPDELGETITKWERLKTCTRLNVVPAPDAATVNMACDKYLALMRHKADIPVLAAVLTMEPRPLVILSGNRSHFNDAVADGCGIKICSCQ